MKIFFVATPIPYFMCLSRNALEEETEFVTIILLQSWHYKSDTYFWSWRAFFFQRLSFSRRQKSLMHVPITKIILSFFGFLDQNKMVISDFFEKNLLRSLFIHRKLSILVFSFSTIQRIEHKCRKVISCSRDRATNS